MAGQLLDLTQLRFQDCGGNMTLRKFFDEYLRNLPQLIKVTQGYYSDTELDSLSNGQIIRVHTYTRQRRAVAKDSNGRMLSIPCNYPLKFQVIRGKPFSKVSSEQSLSDIVIANELPIRIQMTHPYQKSFYVGGHEESVQNFGTLTIIDLYDETYLLGNTVADGQLLTKTITVPLYLSQVLVSTVTGIQNNSDPTQWRYLLDTMDVVARSLHFNLNGGNPNIALYSPTVSATGHENIYDYLEPSSFISLKSKELNISPVVSSRDEDSIDLYHTYMALNKPVGVESEKIPPPPLPHREKIPPPLLPKPAISDKKSGKVSGKGADIKTGTYPRSMSVPTIDFNPNIQQVLPVRRLSLKDSDTPAIPEHHDSGKVNVETLTIQEIGQKLVSLSLEKYVKAFKQQMVNGSILCDLDEKDLRESFKMTKIEALRLTHFARTGRLPE